MSVDRVGASTLLPALRAERLPVSYAVAWGLRGFRRIAADRDAILMEVPDNFATGELRQAVAALRYVAPVILAAVGPLDVHGLLAAGAVNVLRLDIPSAQLAARIKADLRWLARHPRPRRSLAHRVPNESSLLQILAGSHAPICCHHLRWLLGHGRAPIRREALRARIHRLEPLVRQYGLRLRRDSGWGASIYSVRPAE